MKTEPQPVRIPEEFPDYYPQKLWAKTELVIANAVKKYPTLAELIPLARFVVAGLTSDFCRELRTDLRVPRMRELVHWLVTSNCHDYEEQKRVVGEVRNSKEWLALAEASVEGTATAAPRQFAAVRTTQPETQEQRAARRQAVVMPLLQAKKWKPGKLADKAGVGKNSVTHYLNGRRKTITLKNQQAIADALEVKLEEIPE